MFALGKAADGGEVRLLCKVTGKYEYNFMNINFIHISVQFYLGIRTSVAHVYRTTLCLYSSC